MVGGARTYDTWPDASGHHRGTSEGGIGTADARLEGIPWPGPGIRNALVDLGGNAALAFVNLSTNGTLPGTQTVMMSRRSTGASSP